MLRVGTCELILIVAKIAEALYHIHSKTTTKAWNL
jgi:hypothetical protein